MPFFSSAADDRNDHHRFPPGSSRGLDAARHAPTSAFSAHGLPRGDHFASDDILGGTPPTDSDVDVESGDFPSPDTEEVGPQDDSYWQLSRTPLTGLVFALPLVLAYEGGVLLLGRGSPRNGADVWLRHLLDSLGFGSYFLLPLLTVVGLLVWQHLAHDRWRVSLAVLPGMAAECVLWAVVLVGVGRLQQSLWPFHPAIPAMELLQWNLLPGDAMQMGDHWQGVLAQLIGYCGAGLYEEVLFRLLLLPIAVWGFGRLGCGPPAAGFWAVLASSLLFSAAHYVGPLGDSFALYSFTFRVVAGLFFALLFLLRGFGIAAGTHFFYDLLVGLL